MCFFTSVQHFDQEDLTSYENHLSTKLLDDTFLHGQETFVFS